MLYYLVKYRYKIIFGFSFILGIVIEILTGIINGKTNSFAILALIGTDALIAFLIMFFFLLFYEEKWKKLILKQLKGILRKYANKPKKFNFFYNEFVYSKAINLIDLIMKEYREIGRTDKDLYGKLSKYKSFIRGTSVVSYDEAINVLDLSTLFDEHFTLINEVFYESDKTDEAQKKVLEEKDNKLAKILEQEIASKLKDFKRFGEYYN